nr:hypothetical protein [Mesorhizobium sp.]
MRFFDRTYTFDTPSLNQFVASKWNSFGFDASRFLTFRDASLTGSIAAVSKEMDLSLRDVDQAMGILWSVVASAEKKVPFPLLMVLPLIAAYQQRRMTAFETATTTVALSLSPQQRAEFDQTFSNRPIFEFIRLDEFNHRTTTKETASIRDFIAQLQRILSRGITDGIDDSSRVGRYAEDYRNQEFQRLHNDTYSSQPLHSVLRHLSLMIKKAGRLSPEVGAPEKP